MGTPTCSLSVVSHAQGALVSSFLDDLERYCGDDLEVIVVVNLPEDEGYLARPRRMPVKVIRNAAPRGFGANHNAAFAIAEGACFVIANPDIRLTGDPLPALVRLARRPEVGIAGPVVVSPSGTVEDSARKFPTVGRLVRRRLHRERALDYRFGDSPVAVDWIAGMFMVCRREVYSALRGFDESYYLYFEDVDLCERARRMGLEVMVEPACRVIHDARRRSHRDPRYFFWHLRGAVKYLGARRGSAR